MVFSKLGDMLIRFYSLEYGKYHCGTRLCKKLVGKYFLVKDFFVNMDVYFQNMAIRIEAAIMQAKVR